MIRLIYFYLLFFVIFLSFGLIAGTIEPIGPNGGSFSSIAISKSNPEILYAGTGDGIYISTDACNNWRYLGLRGEMSIWSIAVDCQDPDIVTVSGYRNGQSGALQSRDGGLTWREIFSPARVVGSSEKIPGMLFVGNNDGLYKSTDSGDNFVKIEYQFGLNNISIFKTDPIDASIVTDALIYEIRTASARICVICGYESVTHLYQLPAGNKSVKNCHQPRNERLNR